MEITSGKIAKAQKVVIYGTEGIGKSTFASKFPNPIFSDTEGSTDEMDVKRLPKPTSWTMLLQQVEYIKQTRPCKTWVIDTIDWAERMAIEHICSSAGKTSITQFGYGEGFIKLEEEFGRFLNRLQDLVDRGINVVLTAHAKIVKFEQPDEMGAYDRYELKLGNKTTPKTSSLVKEWASLLLFANYKTMSVAVDDKGKKHKAQGGQRVMYTTHHPCWDAKNRQGLPDEVPFNYGSIAHCIPTEAVNQIGATNMNTPIQEPVIGSPEKQETITPIVQKSEVAQETVQKLVPNEYDGIPKALADLMAINNVTKSEIQAVVTKKGYFPPHTPFESYPEDFIQGVLVGAWQQVLLAIEENRKELPFD